MKQLVIPVIESIAVTWDAASAEQRAHIVTLFCWLVEKGTSSPASFSNLLDEISAKAETTWLTPEILDEILRGT